MNKILKHLNIFLNLTRNKCVKYPNKWTKYYYVMQHSKRLNQTNLSYLLTWSTNDFKSKFKGVALLAAGYGLMFALCDSLSSKDDKLYFRSAQFGDVQAMKTYEVL